MKNSKTIWQEMTQTQNQGKKDGCLSIRIPQVKKKKLTNLWFVSSGN